MRTVLRSAGAPATTAAADIDAIAPRPRYYPSFIFRTLVHVSTAFVHGGKSGTKTRPLPQELPDLGGRNAERLYRSAQNAAGGHCLGKEALEAMAELDYPNTYTFTKALGEHLLTRALRVHNRRVGRTEGSEEEARVEKKQLGATAPCLRLRIVRPSIVGPAWMFPWPGWTGEQPSTVTGE